MFTNADQLTAAKMSELQKHIQQENSLFIAVCEMEHTNHKERTEPYYTIPDYTIHPVLIRTLEEVCPFIPNAH